MMRRKMEIDKSLVLIDMLQESIKNINNQGLIKKAFNCCGLTGIKSNDFEMRLSHRLKDTLF